ncbi:MAG: DNA/RNA non-specific endonuclease [Sphingomonadales bacterium]
MRGIIAFLLCSLFAGHGHVQATQTLRDTQQEPLQLELPAIKTGQQIIYHTGFALVYNEDHEQADWVAYELTSEETQKAFERGDVFMKDPLVKTGTADDEDYLHSGYDRGHLAPAADLGYSLSSMAESFYYSNMSPQVAAFNRGVWKRLEGQVRVWARNNGAVYVVTGPVLRPGLPSIGANKVSVPELYYKVILDYRMPEYKALGFVLPNAGSKLPLTEFAVSIDSVERLTGIDFFPALPDKDENELEANICLPCWKWSTSSPSGGKKPTPAAGEAVQCGAATKAGDRCKRMTKSPNGNCCQHGGD